jgi:hypothetical protein
VTAENRDLPGIEGMLAPAASQRAQVPGVGRHSPTNWCLTGEHDNCPRAPQSARVVDGVLTACGCPCHLRQRPYGSGLGKRWEA